MPLITTAGFEDVLEIGRHVRRDIYSSIAETRTLLIPRAKRFGVIERTAANGSIETALDETSVARVIAAVRASGVSTVAVCLLHAYANPATRTSINCAPTNRTPRPLGMRESRR